MTCGINFAAGRNSSLLAGLYLTAARLVLLS